jgi:hypothetical protein
MRLHVTPENLRVTNDIVINENNQLPARDPDGSIPRFAEAAIRLFDDAQRASGAQLAERFGGAVGRSVNNYHDFVLIRGQVLIEKGRERSGEQHFAPIVSCHYRRKL